MITTEIHKEQTSERQWGQVATSGVQKGWKIYSSVGQLPPVRT